MLRKHLIWISFLIIVIFGCAKPDPYIDQQYNQYAVEKAAEKKYNEVRDLAEKKDYRNTIIQGESFLIEYQNSKKAPNVLKFVADAYHSMDEYELAASTYEKFLRLYPNNYLAAEIYRGLGYTYVTLNNQYDAVENFLAYLKLSNDISEKNNIRLLILNHLISELNLNDCKQLVSRYPHTEISSELAYKIIKTEFADGNAQSLTDRVNQFIVNYPDSKYFDEISEIKIQVDKLTGTASIQNSPFPSPANPQLNAVTNSGLKIGIICPVSGQYAKFGSSVIKAAELAINEYKARTRLPVELIIRDSKGHSVEAMRAAQDLIYNEGVVAIIGPILSEAVVTAGSIAQQAGVPLITPTATDKEIQFIGDHIFQFNNTNADLAQALAQFTINYLHISSVSILHPENSYGYDMSNSFSETYNALGGMLQDVIAYPVGTTDFQESIKKIKKNIPGALFIPAQDDDLLLIAPQLNHYEFHPLLLGGNGWNSEKLLRVEGKNVDSTYFVDSFYKDSKLYEYPNFRAQYLSNYNEDPDKVAAFTYDSTRMLLQALNQPQISANDVYNNLHSLQYYEGITGMITIDEFYRIKKRPQMYWIENSQIYELTW